MFFTTDRLYLGPGVSGIFCCRFSWEMLGQCLWQLAPPPWWSWVEMETITNLPAPISYTVCGTFHICYSYLQCCLQSLHMKTSCFSGHCHCFMSVCGAPSSACSKVLHCCLLGMAWHLNNCQSSKKNRKMLNTLVVSKSIAKSAMLFVLTYCWLA